MTLLSEIGLIGFKIESLSGTAETITGAECTLLVEDPKFSIEPISAEQKVVMPAMGTIRQRPGGRSCTIGFKVGLKGSGTPGTAPAIGPLLKACNYSEVARPAVGVWYAATTQAVSAQPTLTMYSSVDGENRVAKGCAGSVKFSGAGNEIHYAEFEFKGVLHTYASAGILTPVLEQTLPDVLLQSELDLLEYHSPGSTREQTVVGVQDLRQAVAINVMLASLLNNSGAATQVGRVQLMLKRTGLPVGFTSGVRASIYPNVLVNGPLVFTGIGLNDITYSGTPILKKQFVIECDGNPGVADTYKWSDNGGTTWLFTNVPMVAGVPQTLNSGISMTATAQLGHTIGERWSMNIQDVPNTAGAVLGSSNYANPIYFKDNAHAWVDFFFPTPVPLVGATKYHVVFNGDFTVGVNILDLAVYTVATSSSSTYTAAAWLNLVATDLIVNVLVAPLARQHFAGASWDVGNTVNLRQDVTGSAEGWDRGFIAGRKPVLTLEPEKEVKASRDLLAYHAAATELNCRYRVGNTVGNKIDVVFRSAQIVKVGEIGDRDGGAIEALELAVNSGIPVTTGNDEMVLKFY